MASLDEMERSAGQFAGDLFARGYILSQRMPVCPSNWIRSRIQNVHIARHPYLEITESQGPATKVVCLGMIFDSRYPDLEQADYVHQLSAALQTSEKALFELLSYSNGRFVLIYVGHDDRCYLVHDATGLRTALYFVGNEITVSSHMNLLTLDVASAQPTDDRKFNFGFPGRFTPVHGVRLLTPNTKLSLDDGTVHRYWPTKAIEMMPFDEAVGAVEDLLETSFDWIDKRYDHFATLTAGLDSRATLSIIGTQSRYATYYRDDKTGSDKIDVEIAKRIAGEFNLKHTVLGPKTRDSVPKEFQRTVKFNTFRAHIPSMPWAYLNNMVQDPQRTIHIRSNLSEIGRRFYHYRGSNPRNGADLTALWTTDADRITDINISDFQEFADATKFFDCPVELTSLFYWEHRMGAWHSQVPMESDIACETLVLYNCRKLLSIMWAVSDEAQKKSLILKSIIAKRWPSLTDIPVNGRPFLPRDQTSRDLILPA